MLARPSRRRQGPWSPRRGDFVRCVRLYTSVCTLVRMADTTKATAPDGRSMRERMLAGELYIADDPELAEASSAALDLMAAFNATTVRQGPLRRRLLERLLGAIGEGTEIRPPFYVDYGSHLTIGA